MRVNGNYLQSISRILAGPPSDRPKLSDDGPTFQLKPRKEAVFCGDVLTPFSSPFSSHRCYLFRPFEGVGMPS
jgi:hypothetical protein